MFFKYLKQLILWFIEVNLITFPLYLLSMNIQPICSPENHIIDLIGRYIMIAGVYQLLTYFLTKNFLDARKDSILAYKTFLEELLLYMETKDKTLAENLMKRAEELNKKSTMIHKDTLRGINTAKQILDNPEILPHQFTLIKDMLIHANHSYEYEGLKWRNTLIIRIFK